MSQHPRKPDPEHAPDPTVVAHERVKADPSDSAYWDEKRMRGAKPRAIRLDPDGSRHIDSSTEKQSDTPESEPKAP